MTEQTQEQTSNIVTLENGKVRDFGKSGKVFASYDVESKTITFEVVTGEVISFDINGIPTNVLEEAAIYGIREKIKSTLSPIKAFVTSAEAAEGKLNVAGKIAQEIESLKEGKFVTRTSEGGTVGLDSFMKAFALVNATGKVNGMFDVPAAYISVPSLRPEWSDYESLAVARDVQEYWDALPKDEKAKQRRNTFVQTQKELLEA